MVMDRWSWFVIQGVLYGHFSQKNFKEDALSEVQINFSLALFFTLLILSYEATHIVYLSSSNMYLEAFYILLVTKFQLGVTFFFTWWNGFPFN